VGGLRIGPEIDPGVPWTVALPHPASEATPAPAPKNGARPLALALKSGNFGSGDFFLKAWSHLS
jgi:uncharacterized protein YgbK (DUF1537 family)